MIDDLRAEIAATVEAVRQEAPLVHCVSAAVSMLTVANGLLAAGARPMMTETAAEGPAMVAVADALLINLGTLSVDATTGVPAILSSRPAHVPWVLDPAAVGVAPVRTVLALQILRQLPTVVRANASEVMVLAGDQTAAGRGPDAVRSTDDALAAARWLARQYQTVVAVSGALDILTDGEQTLRLANGVSLLTRVTGTGCLLGGLTAACCAVADAWTAAATATTWLGVAAETAAGRASGPATFAVALLDELADLSGVRVAAALRTE